VLGAKILNPLAGLRVERGDWPLPACPLANRDEAKFDEPFPFRLDREPNRQTVFGNGPHVCLGQHLVRIEMRIIWEKLLPRLAEVELDSPPERTICDFVCGARHLPIPSVVN
jgi:cytochrome P450